MTFVGELGDLLRDRRISDLRGALDIEGVIAEITPIVLNSYNRLHRTSWNVDDVTDWGFQSIHAGMPEMMSLFNHTWTEHWRDIRCMCDSGLVNALAGEMKLDIVTSRTGVDDWLRLWLKSNDLDRMPLIIRSPKNEKTELHYDIYIDDSPMLAKKVADTVGEIQILVNQPWNQDVKEHERIFRVPDANEAARLLLDVARKGRARALA